MVKAPKRAIKRKRITMQLFEIAAKDTLGNLTKIANNLGIGLSTLKIWLKDNPQSANIIGAEQWKGIDLCENKLHKMALTEEYDPKLQFNALKLILQSKAKDRGYTPNLLQVNTQNNYYEDIKQDLLDTENHIKKVLGDKNEKDSD